MASEEKDVSQFVLRNIHRTQLKKGARNDNKQKEIINVLGSIDDILSIILESNYKLSQQQICKLYHIIINPQTTKQAKAITTHQTSQNDEDMGYNKSVKYKFYDKHIILFSLFNTKTATNILAVLNSKFIKATILLMLIIFAILLVLNHYGLLINVTYIFSTIMWLIFFCYFPFWILYSNKYAIKLLLKQFVFYFKLGYLTLFLISQIWIQYVANTPPMYCVVSYHLALTVLLLLVMMFDAINITQTNKILLDEDDESLTT
eukprot:510884_1